MKKVFSYFLLIPLGISLISCNSSNDKEKNKSNNYTMENNPHFSCQFELECYNGNSSSVIPNFTFTSSSDAKKASIILCEVNDGFRNKGDSVDLIATDSEGKDTIYKLNYDDTHDDTPEKYLTYTGVITNLPKGSLHFKISSELEEQEVELKSRYIFPLDENNNYQAFFSSVNNLDQNDFERLGYSAETELEYISEHLYMKYSHDFGYGTEEMTFDGFAAQYLQHPAEEYYKYKQSDNVYLDIYAKNEYLAFCCDYGWDSANDIIYTNPNRHSSTLSLIESKILNVGNKHGIRYYFKSPDSLKAVVDFFMNLVPHDLIAIAYDENHGENAPNWFQLESVNGINDDSRKNLVENSNACVGYAKTTDFSSANNNQIDIVFSLTQEGLAHKNEIMSSYITEVDSGGQASFDSNTNKLTVKAKAPYLSNLALYHSTFQLLLIYHQ